MKCEFKGIGVKASEEMIRRHKRMTGVDGTKVTSDSLGIHTKEKKSLKNTINCSQKKRHIDSDSINSVS